jgi:NADH dehydrogenase FAD-containing subunit
MPAINGIKMNGEIPRNFKHDSPLGSNGVEADVPILIIGGGPTGLLLAYLLSSYKGTINQ